MSNKILGRWTKEIVNDYEEIYTEYQFYSHVETEGEHSMFNRNESLIFYYATKGGGDYIHASYYMVGDENEEINKYETFVTDERELEKLNKWLEEYKERIGEV